MKDRFLRSEEESSAHLDADSGLELGQHIQDYRAMERLGVVVTGIGFVLMAGTTAVAVQFDREAVMVGGMIVVLGETIVLGLGGLRFARLARYSRELHERELSNRHSLQMNS